MCFCTERGLMTKNYNTSRINKNKSYTVIETAKKLNVCKRTVRRWVKEGLKIIPEIYPYLIKGNDLVVFLKDRQNKRKTKLANNEIYCVKCKKAIKPKDNAVRLIYSGKTLGNGCKDFNIEGICPICKNKIYRLSNDSQKIL